jgi:pheromone shutdown protein TraB
MITLIGVGHVFDIRPNVEKLIYDRMPSVVCVELDKYRYEALLNREMSRDGPVVYKLLSRFQKKMANKYGVDVGEEMLGAIAMAKKIGAKLAFIDVDATFVFDRFWASMSFSEKLKLIIGAFGGVFVRKKQVERELKKFRENSEQYLEMFSKEFPTIKEELIDRRDMHMAKAIRKLNSEYSTLVAVVGDGHIMGISKMLHDLELEIIRLNELREMKFPESKEQSTSTREVKFSYTYSEKTDENSHKKVKAESIKKSVGKPSKKSMKNVKRGLKKKE